MGQIDYFLKFADRATAVADAVAALQTVTDKAGIKQFLADKCTIVDIWRASQDTTTTVTGPGGQQITVPVHNKLAGFYVLISLNRIVPALRDHPAVQLVIDRDKMNARQAGAVIAKNVTNVILQDLRIQPVFAGMNVPWGAFA